MYTCSFCKKTSLAGEKLTLVVTQTRPKSYREDRVGVETAVEAAKCPGCLGTRVTSVPAGAVPAEAAA